MVVKTLTSEVELIERLPVKFDILYAKEVKGEWDLLVTTVRMISDEINIKLLKSRFEHVLSVRGYCSDISFALDICLDSYVQWHSKKGRTHEEWTFRTIGYNIYRGKDITNTITFLSKTYIHPHLVIKKFREDLCRLV